MILSVLMTILVASGGERENRKGIESLRTGDVKSAAKHFDAAVKADTSNVRFKYNRALSKSMAGAPADADWDAVRRDTALSSKALYNRGTARLKAAQTGQGDAKGAISDLAQALKKKPGWAEAAKNLELALRLQKQQEKQKKDDKDKDKKNQDKKDDKKQKNDPKDNGDKDQKPEPKPGQPDPKEALSKDQAEQMLRAAEARDQDRRQKNAQKAKETNGKDW